jgi:AcrR family transcriptional regulator
MTDALPAPQADARTRILDAAAAIVMAKGVAGLTLDAAARDAGVSKGGLLYHFASKEALLTGMTARLAGVLEAEYRTTVEAQPPGPGRVARATLEWGFGEGEHACNERHDAVAAVLLAAFHHDPALIEPVREVIARIRAEIAADGLPPGHGEAISAASDGMFMARIFRLYTPTQAERMAMRAALERLIAPQP